MWGSPKAVGVRERGSPALALRWITSQGQRWLSVTTSAHGACHGGFAPSSAARLLGEAFLRCVKHVTSGCATVTPTRQKVTVSRFDTVATRMPPP